MPRKARVKSRSGIYHIMLRGANRQEIFHDDDDCEKFLETMARCKKKSGMGVFAWCLMNNHVHLLLKEGDEEISTTMKRLAVSYVAYYNWKYRTSGHLFQDRFKSECVENVRYLLTVIRYIHQNPVKARIVDHAIEWRWSSCLEYYGKSNRSSEMLDLEYIMRLFSDDFRVAKTRFTAFNEQINKEECLSDDSYEQTRMSDEEARIEIRKFLGKYEIAQVKGLTKRERDELLRKVKEVKGISKRQVARILGVSSNLIYRA